MGPRCLPARIKRPEKSHFPITSTNIVTERDSSSDWQQSGQHLNSHGRAGRSAHPNLQGVVQSGWSPEHWLANAVLDQRAGRMSHVDPRKRIITRLKTHRLVDIARQERCAVTSIVVNNGALTAILRNDPI